jgi:hypothetical protein
MVSTQLLQVRNKLRIYAAASGGTSYAGYFNGPTYHTSELYYTNWLRNMNGGSTGLYLQTGTGQHGIYTPQASRICALEQEAVMAEL